MNKDQEIKINKIRFIKLGTQKEKKENYCLEHGKMILGYREINHANSIEEIKDECRKEYGSDAGGATRHANQIKSFYDKSETTLWITFAQKRVWWALVDSTKQPYKDSDGYTYQDLKNGWQSEDTQGRSLTFENVSGALLKTQGFQGTICNIANKDSQFDIEEYTRRLINGEKLDEVKEAEENKQAIEKSMADLVKMLHPKDFEYIIDLIFQSSGWKKLTPGAGVEKDLDLDLHMSITEERAFVQIKSSTNQKEYEKYEEIFFQHSDIYDRFFYVYHSSKKDIQSIRQDKPIHLLSINNIAKLIVELGLITLLMKKVS